MPKEIHTGHGAVRHCGNHSLALRVCVERTEDELRTSLTSQLRKSVSNDTEESEDAEKASDTASDEVELKDFQEDIMSHYEKRQKIVREEITGYVWVMYQK